jgi:mRNA interferase RelE/StbE
MNVQLIASAAKDFEELSPRLRQTTLKQLELLRQDLRHPSIRAKKYDGSKNVWQGRVNRDYRFYFRIVGTSYRARGNRAPQQIGRAHV